MAPLVEIPCRRQASWMQAQRNNPTTNNSTAQMRANA
jgi:hypothetical protein